MMNVDWIEIAALAPNRRNARTHSRKQISQIAESIKAFGFLVPILTDEHRNIIAGHGRYAAAQLLGLEKVPVIPVEGLSPPKNGRWHSPTTKLPRTPAGTVNCWRASCRNSRTCWSSRALTSRSPVLPRSRSIKSPPTSRQDPSDPADTVDPEWTNGAPVSTAGRPLAIGRSSPPVRRCAQRRRSCPPDGGSPRCHGLS